MLRVGYACRHGPAPYRSCFAFESRLRDFKDCALLVANNKSVDKRGLELMRERMMLFPPPTAQLHNQKWLSAALITYSVAGDSFDALLRKHNWESEELLQTGSKLKIGSLTLSLQDGFFHCPFDSTPGCASAHFHIVRALCFHQGIYACMCSLSLERVTNFLQITFLSLHTSIT